MQIGYVVYQDEEASDCPLLTPSPPTTQVNNALESSAIFVSLEGNPVESISPPTLENINKEDGLNEFMNIVNSSSRTLNDGRFPSIIGIFLRYFKIIICIFDILFF